MLGILQCIESEGKGHSHTQVHTWAYGVYISQLVRIGRICSSFVQFRDRHYRLTAKLIAQGFWYSRLCVAFKMFSRSHASIFTKYKCSVRKHIEEGICLPAIDDLLSRNVTTCSRPPAGVDDTMSV